MARKTFKVETLRNQINSFLLNSDDSKVAERRGQMTVLESVLHQTGNYNGFCYLSPNDMKKSECGTSFGINAYNDSDELECMQKEKTLFTNTDNTRVYYF